MEPTKASVARRRTSLGIRWIVGVTALGGIGLFVACLEATQIDGHVSSDPSICAATVKSNPSAKPTARYTILVRPIEDRTNVRQSDGEFERSRCEGQTGSANLGHFTLVPETSDGRDHVELVQLMVHTLGGAPEGCTDIDAAGNKIALPPECIVLRRRVRFVPHKGQRVPMYLDDRCLGKSCEEDQTCFRGSCKPADTDCSTGECIPSHERELSGGAVGYDPGRNVSLPAGAVGRDDAGNIVFSDGAVTTDSGHTVSPDGAVTATDGATVGPDGAVAPEPDSALPLSDAGPPDPPDTSIPRDASDGAVDAGAGDGIPVNNCNQCATAVQCCRNGDSGTMNTCRITCLMNETCIAEGGRAPCAVVK